MLVFEAVFFSADDRARHPVWSCAGELTPYNLEELCLQAEARMVGQHASSCLKEVKVTLTGAQKESLLPEVARRLRRLEAQGIRVVVK
jgi:hypothetical protein